MNPYYKDYSEYMGEWFPRLKVQKLSVNAGFSCPNRDGTIGRGGCIYCDNSSFSPSYCMATAPSPREQLEAGKRFFAKKYPEMKYLAYFQSFTNTHGRSLSELDALYREALAVEDVVGLIVGTRPDTLPPEVMDLLGRIAREVPVFLEIGAESCDDATLRFARRGHTWAQTRDAILRGADAGLHVGVHLIAGFPGDDGRQTLENIRQVCSLPVESLKLHQLQVLTSTPLYHLWQSGQLDLLLSDMKKYLDLCVQVIKAVPRHICIERFLSQAPPALVAAPRWNLKNHEFTHLLLRRLNSQMT